MLRGREAEAARNDERVVLAAREVLLEDHDASMAVVARRAGVGVGSLYRRYRDRDDLLAAVCVAAMDELAGLADAADGVAGFLVSALESGAGGLKTLGVALPSSAELDAAAKRLRASVTRLVTRSRRAGTLRDDVGPADLSLVLQQVYAVRVPDPARTARLRRRALELALPGLRPGGPRLPGPAPTWTDVVRRDGR